MSIKTKARRSTGSLSFMQRRHFQFLAFVVASLVMIRNMYTNSPPKLVPPLHLAAVTLSAGDKTTTNKPKALPGAQQSIPLAETPHPNNNPNKEDGVLPRLERIRKVCGRLCEITSKEALEAATVQNSNTLLPQVRVPINCKAIMESEDIDAGDTSVPYPVPKDIEYLFSLSGAIRIHNWKRFVNVYLGGTEHKERTNKWDEAMLSKAIDEVKNGVHQGTYGSDLTTKVRDHLRSTGKIQGSRVLVIGSEKPWVEAICLLLGAKNVVTLEYGEITSTHPNIQTLTPLEFRRQYINGTLGQFDTVVSFSSLEHSGLGRYGDALNPWGDLLAVARAWCVTKPRGALALGIPTGIDTIEFNAHRIYGKIRWPLITANWIQIDNAMHSMGEFEVDHVLEQPLMVFEKMDEWKT